MYKVKCVFSKNGKVFVIECSREYQGTTPAIKRGKYLMQNYENSEFFIVEKHSNKIIKHFKKTAHQWKSMLPI